MPRLKDGTNVFKMKAKDQFDHWSSVTELTMLVDTTPPGSSSAGSVGNHNTANWQNPKVSADGSTWKDAIAKIGSLPSVPTVWIKEKRNPSVRIQVKDSNNEVGVSASDCSGLSAISGDYAYQISSDGGNTWSSWLTTGITTEATDGLKNTFANIAATAPDFANDSTSTHDKCRIRFKQKDKAGNEGTSDEYAVFIDTTNPVYSGTISSSWRLTQAASTSAVTLQDVTSGIDITNTPPKYQISTDGGNTFGSGVNLTNTDGAAHGDTTSKTFTATNPFSIGSKNAQNSGTCQNVIKFTAQDVAGNTVTYGNFLVNCDYSSPTIGAQSPTQNTWQLTRTFESYVQFTDNDSGIDMSTAYFCVSIDGGSTFHPVKTDGTVDTTKTAAASPTLNWSKAFCANSAAGSTAATDLAGNCGPNTAYLFTSMDTGATKGTVNFGIDTTSTSGVQIKFAVKDKAGNNYTTKIVQVGIDTTAPVIESLNAYEDNSKAVQIANGSITKDPDPFYEWNVSDNSLVAGYSFIIVGPDEADYNPDETVDKTSAQNTFNVATETEPTNS